MRCDKYRELLSAYLDGDLSPKAMREVEGHLSVCERCAEELRLLREAVGLVRKLPLLDPPPEIRMRLLKEIGRPGWEIAYERSEEEDSVSILAFELRPYAPARERGVALISWVMERFDGTWWFFEILEGRCRR